MKFLRLGFIFLIFLSCTNHKDMPPAEMIASADSKLWEVEFENAPDNESETGSITAYKSIRFYASGIFTIETSHELHNGTWSYDETEKTLSFDFEGETITETYQVESMDPDELHLVLDEMKITLNSR